MDSPTRAVTERTKLPGEGGLFHNLIFQKPLGSNALIKVRQQNSSRLLLLTKALLFSRGQGLTEGTCGSRNSAL